MSADSPLWNGLDTGFGSRRTVIFSRWPVSGMPPSFRDEADYDRRVQHLPESGLIPDTGRLYWQARLSERHPTFEVRCLDVQLRVDDEVMFAGLIRALVETALGEATAGPRIRLRPRSAAGAHAARGPTRSERPPDRPARRTTPRGRRPVPAPERRHPALEAAGGTREVTGLTHRLPQHGTGADRQRTALVCGGLEATLDLITSESTTP